ncbi:hypothetical protein B9Z55_011434 [Caenorhabditis nigoni]|uniref:Uncharacterized protein n=1 Tax=Caenorhabditis nigoni TaxID=1611254 RepID=A0A2G5UK29_9PELO|nr:hypothetical protein B9Z55_011434 [Caenorhabditis nigoni]
MIRNTNFDGSLRKHQKIFGYAPRVVDVNIATELLKWTLQKVQKPAGDSRDLALQKSPHSQVHRIGIRGVSRPQIFAEASRKMSVGDQNYGFQSTSRFPVLLMIRKTSGNLLSGPGQQILHQNYLLADLLVDFYI